MVREIFERRRENYPWQGDFEVIFKVYTYPARLFRLAGQSNAKISEAYFRLLFGRSARSPITAVIGRETGSRADLLDGANLIRDKVTLKKSKNSPNRGFFDGKWNKIPLKSKKYRVVWGVMETLTKLLGNDTKVKVLKQFIFNVDTPFDIAEVSLRTKESPAKVRKEISNLEKMHLIKRRVYYKNIPRNKNSRRTSLRAKANGFILNDNFQFLVPLQSFIISLNHLSPKELLKKLNRGGSIKLIILAGVFIQNPESRIDLLVVGDHLKIGTIESIIRTIESEIGKEIRYAIFDTVDFKYRLGLYDKLIRDILDYPHEKILNKLGVE